VVFLLCSALARKALCLHITTSYQNVTSIGWDALRQNTNRAQHDLVEGLYD
jgi:hypothetical protein